MEIIAVIGFIILGNGEGELFLGIEGKLAILRNSGKLDWLPNFRQSPVQGATRPYRTQLLNNSNDYTVSQVNYLLVQWLFGQL